MKNNYKTGRMLLFILALQFSGFIINAQVTTFQQVYPSMIHQSGRDVLPTADGGYLIAGMTTTTIGDSNIYMIKTDYLGNIIWTTTYGGSQPDYPYTLIPTNDGNFFVLGFTMSYGAGNYDTWLLKIDPAGTILWSKTYGGTGHEEGHEIIPTTDGNFMITGESNNDAFLLKIDPAGNTIWTQTYGGVQYETSHSVKQCLDGGYIFSGQTYSYGMGSGDIYIVKTDATGNLGWAKTYGGIYNDDGMYVLANPDGTYMIDSEASSGSQVKDLDVYLIKVDANGDSLWTKRYGGADKDVTHYMSATSDGGYIIASTCRSFWGPNPNMWIVKIDAAGGIMWTNYFGSWYHDHAYAIKQTADGGYIVIGHQEDQNSITHAFFVKMDGAGQVSVEEFASDNLFDVYPNPTNGIIKINSAKDISSSTVSICNGLGQVFYTETMDATTRDKIIDIKDKEPGIYFVSIQSAKNVTTKKIVLK